jgi:hypothetical protein
MLDAAFTTSILIVDPNPAAVGQEVEIVFRVVNTGAAEQTFSVELVGAPLPLSRTFTAAAGDQHLDSFKFLAGAAGTHALQLRTSEAVGTILVRHGPTDIRRETRFGNTTVERTSYVSFSPLTPPMRPRASRIGPRDPSVADPASNSSAGVIGRLAGGVNLLYAVSKHAGVWKTSSDGMWRQLRGSPRRAAVIAVDPTDSRHVVVGERPDDTAVFESGDEGVWESLDAGETWRRIFDPALDSRLFAGGSGIRGVAFGPYGRTVLIATSMGVGVRASRPDPSEVTRSFEFPASAQGDIRELTAGDNVVWALTDTAVLRWRIDANGWRDLDPYRPGSWPAWTRHTIPNTTTVWPESGSSAPTTGVLTASRTGLSGFDDIAFLSLNPVVPLSHPRAIEDPNCVPPNTGPTCDIFKNRMALLVFNSTRSAGSQWSAQLSGDNDGRGLGGRAFTIAATLNCAVLPDVVGRRRRLYLISSQSIQEAATVDGNDRVVWTQPTGTRANGVHSDIWDFHVDSTTCPPGDFAAYIAADGGVFRGRVGAGGIGTRPNPDYEGAIDGLQWVPASLGLETHNVHVIGLAKRPFETVPHILYATGDNDGWWGVPGGPWTGGGTAGDANVALTDGASPWGIAFRGFLGSATTGPCGGGNCAYSTGFGTDIDQRFNIGGRTVGFASPTVFTFIQKLASETSTSGIHAAMLVQLPLKDADGNLVDGNLGAGSPASRLAIIRTKDYASTIGVFTSGWTIAVDNVPKGTERFWVGGGIASPRFFVFTPTSTTCPQGLQTPDGSGGWRCLERDLPFADDDAAREQRDGWTFMAPQGPVFVNPYDPAIMVATVLGATPHVELTRDGGTTWCAAPALTGLVTASGRYPLVGDDGAGRFDPRNRFGAVGSAYHGSVLARISQVAFDRSHPSQALVVTPTAGVYFADLARRPADIKAGIQCREPAWRSVQEPDDNWGYPAAGALLDGTAYVGTEGNGMFQLNNPASGLLATYFDVASTFAPGAVLARLRTSEGPLGWGRYSLQITGEVNNPGRTSDSNQSARSTKRTVVNARAGNDGAIRMPTGITIDDLFAAGVPLVCDLEYLSDGRHAATRIRFKCSN